MTEEIDIDKLIIKEFGNDILKNGNFILDKKLQTIPFSPQLDIILGGGIIEGSTVTLTGPPKCGKTLSCLDFASTCQQEEYGEREIYYCNIEGRLKKRDLQGIKNLKMDKFHVIGSTSGNILSAEKYLAIAEKYLNNKEKCVVIIDSYSDLCTDVELTSSLDKMQRCDVNKLIAKFCRRISNVIPISKGIMLGITHLMGNPSGYGPSLVEKSGNAIAYRADFKIRAKSFKEWKINEKNVGIIVEWKCLTTGSTTPPLQTTTSYIRFGTGIDKIYETITLGVDIGIIQKGGAWYTFEEQKLQGLENLRTFFVQNGPLYDSLQQQIKDALV